MIDSFEVLTLELDLNRTFRIARGATDTIEELIVRLDSGETIGWGAAHASPSVSGETVEDARRALDAVDPADLDPDDVEASLDRLAPMGPAAQAAIDLALHDLAGRRAGTPVHRSLELPAGEAPSAATITVADPADAADQAQTWLGRGYTRLKIKVDDASAVLDTVDAVKAVIPETLRPPMPDPEIWIDANEAFGVDEATELVDPLAERGVALIEQPLPRDEIDASLRLAEASPVPIVLDEPITSPVDIERLARSPEGLGINIKVQKVGGLLAAKRCLHVARGRGLAVMVGCNTESGLGIAAGACLVGTVDHVDLDGNLFLQRDPFPMPRPMPGHVGTLEGPGLGVHPDPRFDALNLAEAKR